MQRSPASRLFLDWSNGERSEMQVSSEILNSAPDTMRFANPPTRISRALLSFQTEHTVECWPLTILSLLVISKAFPTTGFSLLRMYSRTLVWRLV
jgi:hypothetical protein